MIRFRLAAILKQRGWSPYRLARATGLTVPTAYRLADPDLVFGRFTADTLDRICAALEVQPGDLLEWAPSKNGRSAHDIEGSSTRTARGKVRDGRKKRGDEAAPARTAVERNHRSRHRPAEKRRRTARTKRRS